jgi:NAD(P)H-hydrate epimerase
MSRLTGQSIAEVQADRLKCARTLARDRNSILVLKGDRTLIAMPDGRVWINPTGSPSMATGGSGDVLTGLIAGMLAQFPKTPELAVAAAVYLHGRAGEFGAVRLTELSFLAGDILTMLPDAIHDLYY